ncbi:MAG: TonB-dependent receptor [Gemmatimonadaceae bacterium]|nr:TonB-dependent receptor [Gemmatimonadaceae bacterium]
MQRFISLSRYAAFMAAFFFSGYVAVANAQLANSQGARVAGRIIDGQTGAGLTDAGVQITGTTTGTMSSIDGRYVIGRVPAGTLSITVRRLGYAPKTITGIEIKDGQAVEQNISLQPATVQLTSQVVSASAERGTINEALNRQRTSASIVNAITADQITRSTDSDAAQAVRRVSGVTVQDGKYVFVRGLGERYTTASLNGARIPSPEPEKKIVPLDLFPSALLQSITTSKSFTPDQAGDFSGAQVNIKTREFPAHGMVTYSTTVGFNSLATGKTIVAAPTIGQEWLAVAGNKRLLPASVRSAGNFSGSNQTQMNQAVNAFRNAWTPVQSNAAPNLSTALSMGGQHKLFGRSIGYIASGSYANTQEIKQDEHRALAVPDGKGSTKEFNSFTGSSSNRSVLLGGLLNVSTLFGTGTRIELNNTYNRTADNEAKLLEGQLDEFLFAARRSALGFIARTVRANQLRIEHAIGSRQQLDLSVTSSGVSRVEPDRSEIEYVREQNPLTGATLPYALFSYNPEGARRTYGDLRETNTSVSTDYRLGFGDAGNESVLKFGGAFRFTDRTAINTSYSILGYGLSRSARQDQAEQIFDGRYATGSASVFNVVLNSTGGSYGAQDQVAAGYGMAEIPLGQKLKVIAGARVEGSELRVNSISTSGEKVRTTLANTDILPALVANIALTPSQTLRLSASQTVSRPEYRELSPITYRDVIEQRDIFGNPKLKRALIQNYDVRWEMYPNAGEIMSLGFFGKRFTDPVERVDVATSGASQLSFVNADAAINYGVEVDLRKRLGWIAEPLEAFTLFTNATVMRSQIDITSDKLSSLTNKKRAMVGQAPYVVNAGLSYSSESGKMSSTLLYNVVGKRITAAGVTPLPDTYEMPRNILDLSIQFPVYGGITAKMDARNLLDAPVRVEQGAVTRESYRSGRILSLGFRVQK